MYFLRRHIAPKFSKNRFAFLIFCFFFFLSNSNLFGQQPNLYFKHYTNRNGLSQNTSKCIVQDSTGFIWVGTEDGLNRFDGYNFVSFHEKEFNKNGLSSDYISSLAVDKYNRLWIGTWGGLNCYQQETANFHSFVHEQAKSTSIVSNIISTVFIDSDNYIWLGSAEGLNRSQKPLNNQSLSDSIEFMLFTANTKKNALIDNNIKAISEDKDQNIWVASSLGLNKIDKKNGSVTTYALPSANSGNNIVAISSEINGNIWVGTDKSLYVFDIIHNKFFNYNKHPFFRENKERNQILSFTYDGNGGLFIGTKNIGLIHLNINSGEFSHFQKEQGNNKTLNNRQISDLIIDKSNNLFAVGLNGIDAAEIKTKPFGLNKCIRKIDNRLLSPNILSAYCQNKDLIWLGLSQQGLALYNRKTKQFKNYLFEKQFNGRQISVKYIYPINKTIFLLATQRNGLLVFNTKTGLLKQYNQDNSKIASNILFFITKDHKGNYIISTQNNGLSLFNLEKETFHNYLPNEKDTHSISHRTIPHVFVDSKNNIWVATFGGGLNRWNEETGQFTQYKHILGNPSSISSNKVTHIFEDSQATLWVGTAAGLNKFNPETGNFVQFKKKDGLINEFVYAILEDNNSNLWISTNYGIIKFNKLNESFTGYDMASGLQNNEFNINVACKTPDSLLFFGGISGFNLFNPKAIKNSNFTPNIAITSFKMFYKEVIIGKKYDDEIVLTKSINDIDTVYLDYKNNQFSFEFSAFDYTKPFSIQYAVRLKGFNNLWHKVPATKRYISYTNLIPGTYNLQIKASNADGVWNANIKNLVIIIKKPFYKTWWFFILIAISLVFILFTIMFFRTKYLLKQKKELERQVKERTRTIKQKNTLLLGQKEELKQQTEELRSISEKLKELNNSLEKKIESRTTDLNSALEKAEDAQRLISAFLANMSHELRTPMNAISGFAQLIADASLNDTERQSYAGIINTNIESLLSLIENIMDVSKLHTGQYKFINNTFSFPDLCLELYNELNNSSKKHANVDFIFNYENLPKLNIYSDRKALRHIIYNLLDNALKYTEKGSVEFICNCEPNVDKNKVYVTNSNHPDTVLLINISDTGLGIKKEFQNNIFDTFQKVEHNKNKLFRGTGLGLALVKSLTEKLLGKIKLESELHKGTKVSIKIPLSPKD